MKSNSVRGMGFLVLVIVISMFLTACGPPKLEIFEDVESYQTAFVVPLEIDTKEGQEKFLSEDFLAKSKVAAKRISLDTRRVSTGYGWWSYRYVPTVRVIEVDRTPVTRDWTSDESTGSTKSNMGVWVQSLDSIDFGVGITITTEVTEDDAAKFLYHYAGKSLSDITDRNVRGFITADLSSEFGALPLGNVQKMVEAATKEGRDLTKESIPTCFTKRSEVINKVFERAKVHFAKYGLTITKMGGTEGFVFKDDKIRQSINATFTSAMRIQEEENINQAQAKINARTVDKAKAEADSAKKFSEAADSRTKQVMLDIELKNAEARLMWANNWKGVLPGGVIPSNSPLMLNIAPPVEHK